MTATPNTPHDRPLVTWKDEGSHGPVRVISAEERNRPEEPFTFKPGRPYEPPAPWMTQAAAEKMARRLGADFETG